MGKLQLDSRSASRLYRGERRFGAPSLIALAIAGLSTSTAYAQAPDGANNSNDTGLAEIVVVAQKRSESSQKVPIALTAVPAKELTASGALTSATLNTAVPGLTINSTAVYFSPRIRGIGTTAFGPGVENPVSLYVDDVYYASQLTAPSDLTNVDQLTVLKGPQGTLFGRNATGGVMQMTTRNPKKEFSGEVSTQLDQYLTSRNFLYVTGGNDLMKANLSASYATQGEGWGKNLVTGNDNHKIDHDIALRSKIVITPTDRTEIKLIGDYYNRRNSMGPNVRPLPGGVYAFPGGLATSAGLISGAIVPPGLRSNNDFDSAALRDSTNLVKGGGGSIHISQDLGFAKFVSISAYRKYRYDTYFDTGGAYRDPDLAAVFGDPSYGTTFFPIGDSEFTQKGWQFSQELQLASQDDSKLKWVAGAYYFKGKERINGLIARFYGQSQSPNAVSDSDPNNPTALTLPEAAAGLDGNFLTGSQSQDFHVAYGTESLAGFAQATYEILPQTRLTGGFRYTWEKRTREGFIQILVNGVRQPVTDTATGLVTATGNLSDAAPGDSISVKRPTWRIALDHDFARNILGYVSWNRGFKSGGYNALSATLVQAPYKPEKLDAYEVGFKSELFNRTLRFNPGFFYYDYSQIQVTRFTASSTSIINGAKAQVYGLNLDAVWQPTHALTFNGGFEWLMKAKFKSFPNAPATIPVRLDGTNAGDAPSALNSVVFPGGVYNTTTNAAGNQLPYAAKLSGNIGVTYSTELAGAKVDFNINDAYNSGFYTEVDNRLRQGATNILSTSLTWTAPGDRLQLSLFARNLLDDRLSSQLSSQAPVGDIVDYANPPRTYGFSIKYLFGAM